MAWMNGIRKLANGGLLNQPTLFSTKSGLAIGGEAGTEAVMPLTRTAGGKLGVYSAGGGGVQINIIDQRTNKDSSPVDVQEKQGADGVRRIQVLIRDTVKGMHNSGEMDRTMASNYGVARKGVR
jgi:phage-related minor tail protein